MNDKEFDALLIYNMKDREKAEVLASKLTNAGLRVWFDQWQLIPGSLWAKEIENAISRTKIICICIGPNGLGESSETELLSVLSMKESNEEILVVPILLPGSSPEAIPSKLKAIQFADLRNDINNWDSFRHFVEIIQRQNIKAKDTDFNQSDQIAKGSQTNILGNVSSQVLSGQFQGPVYINAFAKPIKLVVPCQIPSPPSDFKGRDNEIRDAMINFDQGSTITVLRGMGGVGKTALALVLANKLKDRFPDGQFFIDLCGTSNKPLTPAEAMAHVMRAYFPSAPLPEAQSELRGMYLSVLSGKRALILLDNAAGHEQVEPLLPPVGCAILITTRRKFILPGMNVQDLNTLSPADARNLLLAIDERIGYHADELAKLCGYLPLALRNAAGVLTERIDIDPAEYARRLRDARARLDLVEASFSLSYDILSPEKQKLWCMLSVFTADFDSAGAAAVWEMESEATAAVLSELVKWRLVDKIPLAMNGNALLKERYCLHDLARLFASSHLDSAFRAVAQQKHAECYENVLSNADELYKLGGKNLLEGLNLLDREWTNIRAGQAWAKRNLETNSSAARLCNSYPNAGAYVLDLRLHPKELISWLETALAAARELKDCEMEGNHLGNLGLAYAGLGDARKAIEYCEQHLVITREMGDRWGEGCALGNMGLAYADLGDVRKAIEYYEQALAIDRETGDKRGEGTDLSNLGLAYFVQGNPHRAIKYYEQALAIDRETGDKRSEGCALGNMGLAYAGLGDARKAIEYYEQQLAITREIGDRRGKGNALGNLGVAYANLGDARKAIEYYEQQLAITREIGDRRGEGNALGNLGSAYFVQGDLHKAIEYYEPRVAIAREIGDRQSEGNTLFNMCLTLEELGQRVEAIDNAKAALKILEQIESPLAEKVRQKLAEWQEPHGIGSSQDQYSPSYHNYLT